MPEIVHVLSALCSPLLALLWYMELRAHRQTLAAWIEDMKRWNAAATGVVEQWQLEVNHHMDAVAILSDARACLPPDLLLRYRKHLFNQAEELSKVIAWRNSLDRWNQPVPKPGKLRPWELS